MRHINVLAIAAALAASGEELGGGAPNGGAGKRHRGENPTEREGRPQWLHDELIARAQAKRERKCAARRKGAR